MGHSVSVPWRSGDASCRDTAFGQIVRTYVRRVADSREAPTIHTVTVALSFLGRVFHRGDTGGLPAQIAN